MRKEKIKNKIVRVYCLELWHVSLMVSFVVDVLKQM